MRAHACVCVCVVSGKRACPIKKRRRPHFIGRQPTDYEWVFLCNRA